MQKKRRGWIAAIVIPVALLQTVLTVLIAVWLFTDDGYYDDGYYDDGYYDDGYYDDGYYEDEYYEDEYYDDGYYEDGYSGDESDGYDGRGSDAREESAAPESAGEVSAPAVLTADEAVRENLTAAVGGGQDTVTVLVYMNGSDLESEDGSATEDLAEMVAAGGSDKVNLLVETLGTKSWRPRYGISSETAQRWRVDGSGLTLAQDGLGSVNCGDAAALTDFIRWGTANYPADRYVLIFWDHGGGPVYGFGYDDKTESEDSLTIAEMRRALRDAGTVFDFIGMDCCIMSGIEVSCALYDWCDYTILSEDFEPGTGWYYTDWLRALCENSSVSVPELGRIIVDSMVRVNTAAGEDAILAVIDESYMKLLYASWLDFAYANEDALLGTNYSRPKTRKAGYRVSPVLEREGYFTRGGDRGIFDLFYGEVGMEEYYVTDLMAVAGSVASGESEALASALDQAIVYMNACGGSADLTGFSVTLPYGDDEFYGELREIFLECGFESSYVEWLEAFTTSSGGGDYYDYDEWDDSWDGWEDWEDDYDWSDWFFEWGEDSDEYDEYDDGDDWDWGWSDWDW